ncbi:hypothetical protein GOP47_0004340 [Adiantum capillus-veneris]|uniref:Actin-binding transcription modulator n=1 Tax=Adiantum capillus-veneris TaxID=13818 RepID=A0A9D4ZPG8_ADICA|nr:hypothetical protein GOP47_0004340 [Adiantum capillus-veneris]
MEETEARLEEQASNNDGAAVHSSGDETVSLYPAAQDLPLHPPQAIHSNYSHFFVVDFMKENHDQYIYRHNNGLCIIGLAPTHIALRNDAVVTAVDFNVGKQSRAEMKVSGKRKNDARVLEPTSALCKVVSDDATYVVRCCVRGALLEVNERLMKEPTLLKTKAASEGFIAIMMPRPGDWKKALASLLTAEEYDGCVHCRNSKLENQTRFLISKAIRYIGTGRWVTHE